MSYIIPKKISFLSLLFFAEMREQEVTDGYQLFNTCNQLIGFIQHIYLYMHNSSLYCMYATNPPIQVQQVALTSLTDFLIARFCTAICCDFLCWFTHAEQTSKVSKIFESQVFYSTCPFMNSL